MSYIYAIGTAVPTHMIEQKSVAQFMANQYNIDALEKNKIVLMYERSGIETRYSVIEDFKNKALNTLKPGNTDADIKTRMELYFKHAPQLAVNAVKNCINKQFKTKDITHIITVSCTGMAAPGLDITLVKLLKLNDDIARTSVNFMGCYAVMHALKIADAICKADKNALVLIVSVELCTIHFQSSYSTDNIAANLLFSDGAGACLVGSNKKNKALYRINKFYSKLVFKGISDMAWHIGNTGFNMTLSNYIPQIIEENFRHLPKKLKLKHHKTNLFAIHPGGRKIVDKIKADLDLKDQQLQSSYYVLKHFGNMSSPTILFVLKNMADAKISKNKKVMAAAFGPGLTIETAYLKLLKNFA